MKKTSAKILLDSIHPQSASRVTTFEVTMHRFVLAEGNTHRECARNSRSSRAVPYEKTRKEVLEYPAIPLSWPSNQPGMQGGEELGEEERELAIKGWLLARDLAVEMADGLHGLGVHKTYCNRLLEPFMWQTIIWTWTDASTSLPNFFIQRCSPLAQPEIRVAAEMMRKVYQYSIPQLLGFGEHHLPLVARVDEPDLRRWLFDKNIIGKEAEGMLKDISAARCARVSYLTHDGVRDPEKDLELAIKLKTAYPPHASPFEHVCTPAKISDQLAGDVKGCLWGWRQYRHELFK